MASILLEKSELLSLLELNERDGLVGVGPEHLTYPEPTERSIILDDGRSRLLEKNRLTVAADRYEIEPELAGMMAVIIEPHTVVRIRRTIPAQEEEFWFWYFVSGKELVRLSASGEENFELSRVSDVDDALAQISEILPVEPVSQAVTYRATADQEEADTISALFHDWDEVPALTMMEADGLTPAAAMEFYNDLSEPHWRGEADFMACLSGQITTSRRLLVLQGQDLSWLAWQDNPSMSDIHVQTAAAGALEGHIINYLTEVLP